MLLINKIHRLREDDNGANYSVVRFCNKRIDGKKKDKSKFFRRDPIMIISEEGKVIRFAVGARDYSITMNEIALDYEAIDLLNIKFGEQQLPLRVRRAYRHEIWFWYCNHPEVSIRFATRVGVLGILLGLVGVALGAYSHI